MNELDKTFLEFDEYKKRPFSLPYIGNELAKSGNVLFVLESHYIDPEFFQYQYDKVNLDNKSPDLFYNVVESGLTSDFKGYLNTRQIIADSISPDAKKSKGKSVYRKIFGITQSAFGFQDLYTSMQSLAICNYFQRPSYKFGKSITVSLKDAEVAYKAFEKLLSIVEINKIVFTSAKAYDSFIKLDNINGGKCQRNRKIFRGTHPRTWGFKCVYEKELSWKQWIQSRLIN